MHNYCEANRCFRLVLIVYQSQGRIMIVANLFYTQYVCVVFISYVKVSIFYFPFTVCVPAVSVVLSPDGKITSAKVPSGTVAVTVRAFPLRIT